MIEKEYLNDDKGDLSMLEVERIDKQLNKFDERLRKTELALERNNVITQQNTAEIGRASCRERV